MFELIMLVGFGLAAFSQLLPEEPRREVRVSGGETTRPRERIRQDAPQHVALDRRSPARSCSAFPATDRRRSQRP